ncbi:hypothetical protein P8452_37847 [Trifolium repens]|nr:hypothetical protein P8452_37847 [Trifolium repens]
MKEKVRREKQKPSPPPAPPSHSKPSAATSLVPLVVYAAPSFLGHSCCHISIQGFISMCMLSSNPIASSSSLHMAAITFAFKAQNQCKTKTDKKTTQSDDGWTSSKDEAEIVEQIDEGSSVFISNDPQDKEIASNDHLNFSTIPS